MIRDLKLTPLETHVDDRGYLTEVLRATDEHFTKFGQVYVVGNLARNVIRAWHKHQVLWDWFFISHGSAKFAFCDDRKDSPTHKEINTLIIGDKNPGVISVPPGVFHGWMSLEDDTQLISIASEVYNRKNPDEERVPYDSFNYDWSVKFK